MGTGQDHDELKRMAEEAGQGHLFHFWGDLDQDGRTRLAGEIASLDFPRIRQLGELLGRSEPKAAESFEPPELFPLERSPELQTRAEQAIERGSELLSSGSVGYVLVAGGQGSRLGYDGPKGKFRVGPVTDRTLFQWHAARLAAAAERSGAATAWYVMTSASNHAETQAYFEEQDWFGLGESNVLLFQQRMLPALGTDGRVLMAAPDRLFLAPNGHGGTLDALRASGALEHAASRGIEHLSYFQVDNPLARPADPLFLGLHAEAGAEMSSKVVSKRDAGEKVGVIGVADGVLGCIEYSDLPDDLRLATDGGGQLLFRAGNIAAHVIDRAFIDRLTSGGDLQLPWHLARKRISTIDESGSPVEVDGVKFETFVFDALGEARASVTLEVDRALEFSPVKNAEGQDSPASCRADLGALFAGWASRAGLDAPPVAEDGSHRIEVDPRFAEDEPEFLRRSPAGPDTHPTGGHVYQP